MENDLSFLVIEDLENRVDPAGVSDAVGGPVCVGIAIFAALYSNVVH
jgi:hypothetical protein